MMLGYFSESHEGHIKNLYHDDWGFPDGDSGKEPACQCRRLRDVGLIPKSGRSPGGWHGYPLQYSCLENPMDRGAWRAIAHAVAKSQTRLKRLTMHVRSQ